MIGMVNQAEYKTAAKGESNRHLMKDVFLSRRRCLQVSALAGCSMLLVGRVSAAEEPSLFGPDQSCRRGPDNSAH
jgi:hypothetical protein